MNCTLPYPEPVDAFVFVINSHIIRGAWDPSAQSPPLARGDGSVATVTPVETARPVASQLPTLPPSQQPCSDGWGLLVSGPLFTKCRRLTRPQWKLQRLPRPSSPAGGGPGVWGDVGRRGAAWPGRDRGVPTVRPFLHGLHAPGAHTGGRAGSRCSVNVRSLFSAPHSRLCRRGRGSYFMDTQSWPFNPHPPAP